MWYVCIIKSVKQNNLGGCSADNTDGSDLWCNAVQMTSDGMTQTYQVLRWSVQEFR
jgi:hypothetical protein